jgi:tRNA 2-thiouridine synthesizing protein E
VNPHIWTEQIAKELARELGIPKLNEIQWKIILVIRTYYLANGKAPLNREIIRETGMKLLEVERLFPGGIRHGVRLLAGLPNPRSC